MITASAAADMVVAAVGMNAPLISTDFEVQVGKGPASSETVLVWLKGRMSSSLTVTPGYQALYNPRDGISAGDRVVARFRKEGTSTTGPDVHILYYEKPL